MFKKKLIPQLILAMTTATVLVGCGGDGNSTPAAQAPTDNGSNNGNNNGGSEVSADLTRYVNPFIGSDAGDAKSPVSTGKGGSIVPAAGLPRGMIQWSPDTNTTSRSDGSPAGYYYDETTIKGFSLTHMNGAGGSGNDGEFPIMPTTDLGSLEPSFSHDNESASAGYYSVALDSGIKVELTATLRTGFGRFTYPSDKPAYLVFDTTRTNTMKSTPGSVTKVSDTAISGETLGGNFHGGDKRVKMYFYAEFDQKMANDSTFDNGIAKVAFDVGAAVQMKVGISYVSLENAKQNLATENAGWSFDAVHTAAIDTWNQNLHLIDVGEGTDEQLTKFYTSLYRSMWAPRVFSDVNGQYIGFNGQTYTVKPNQQAQYTAFSGWDVYRSLTPLQALLFPKETSDAMQSLVNFADQCGAIPHWVSNNAEIGIMPGDAGSLMVAGAYAFGARNFDTTSALNHMIKMANVPGTACSGVKPDGSTWSSATNGGRSSYLKYGYISEGEGGSASSTLEYESSDFAIAKFAEALSSSNNKNADYAKIIGSRSAYWKNLLKADLNPPLIAPREGNGNFKSVQPNTTNDYTQGNAEQYTWMVPHDLGGLTASLGSPSTVVSRLDQFFTYLNGGTNEPYFYMGNEPTFQVPWTYNWVGAPAKTQEVVQAIAEQAFGTGADGLAGNDDLGALSGWYVWASLGLYPMTPGVGGFAISSPQFPSITVHLANNKTLQINAPGAPKQNYIQALTVAGKPHDNTWLDLADISNGATMSFSMGEAASSWGSTEAPRSFPIATAESVADAYNTNGISADGETNFDGKGAAIDGSLNSYSETALANVGMAPGSTIMVDGARFTLPGYGAQLDTITPVGQSIEFPAAQRSSKLVFLGLSTNGPSTGTATVTYTDGTTTDFTLAMDDNTIGANASASVATGVAARTTYRNSQNGDKSYSGGNVYGVFYFSQPLDATKVVKSVTLPGQLNKGRMRLFGISLATL